MSQFNNENVLFELQIQNNTLVSNLGKLQIMSSNNIKPNRVQLSDVLNTTKLVNLEGYVKSNFASIHNSKLNKTIGCGSIRDGVYKLEVYIIDFNEDNYHKELIQKGNKIELTGIIQNTGIVRNHLNEVYGNNWMGTNGPIRWPPRSPDHNPCDFFLWGCVKENVYFERIETRNDLEEAIEVAFASIDPDMIRRATESVSRRAQKCLDKVVTFF
ncbi:uncharacterized protein LOC118647836 [Monomorium pharaonis]|uniref:uncharacterized protein LOC118647836 n=1 Tax=Monomorium pharaonis TaxID=307658 RepID=UPI0017465824|nr:uncharacterized protein LOC118647836 [Monomorium pharaonis]XP_036149429.1 uncharacterized protein LOC118647836 [Monomorium pharaonis]